MYEEDKDNLYALQIDEDAEKRARESAIYSFANEHAFTENQVVRFPSTMGVNGFSFQTNSVAYFAKGKDLLKPKKQFCSLYSVNMRLVPEETQEATGHHLTKEFPFNVKSDNFLGLSSIQNLVVAAMTDEEQMGTEKPVGTFQLFNRLFAPISQYDLARVQYLRKLVGSTIRRVNYCSKTLQTMIGLNLDREEMNGSLSAAEWVMTHRSDQQAYQIG